MPPAHTTRKNLRKDCPNLLEESVFSKLEVDPKLKLEKLKIEFKMRSAPLEQLLNRA